MSGHAGLLAGLGLARAPFPTTPDASAYYPAPRLERDFAEAMHCLYERSGFVLLTGEVGTGKSTFLRRMLDQAERDGLVSSLVLNTFLQGGELLAAILRDFGLEPRNTAAADVEILNRFLIELRRNGHGCVLVIDDAQNLDLQSLELLRLLSSLETGQEKLLQIVLAGQPELRTLLDQPGLRQLTSRIVKHVRLESLAPGEILDYVRFRLRAAGAPARLQVEDAAAGALHATSRGNPRRLHLVMDRCLYGLLAQDRWCIDAALVRSAAAEAGALPSRPRRRPPAAPPSLALAAAFGLLAAATVLGLSQRTAVPVSLPARTAGQANRPACEAMEARVANAFPRWQATHLGLPACAEADGAWSMPGTGPVAPRLTARTTRMDSIAQAARTDAFLSPRP